MSGISERCNLLEFASVCKSMGASVGVCDVLIALPSMDDLFRTLSHTVMGSHHPDPDVDIVLNLHAGTSGCH